MQEQDYLEAFMTAYQREVYLEKKKAIQLKEQNGAYSVDEILEAVEAINDSN